jgi:tetratricopeptide (TPR) repeat protein
MGRRAILQIGTEKTGTTTLQRFLAANRAELARRGVVYPRFCGAVNHTGLAAFALDQAKVDPLRAAFGARGPSDAPALRDRLRRAAAAELDGAGDAVFCNEHCHSRLTTPAEVETLRDFLAGFFDEVVVDVTLRRQDQVALSLRSTRLKSGATDRDLLPRTGPDDPYFNYDRSLGLWEAAFGAANVRVRLFDRAAFGEGGIVGAFLGAWGLGPLDGYVRVANENESLDPAAQEFLRRINAHLAPVAGLPIEDVRGPLAAALARLRPGRGARPARAEAEAFYARFRAANEAVRARRFPERAALFDEDFSGYPETADPLDIDLDAAAAVAAALHAATVCETRRLEAEIAIRDARLAWARGEPAEAERALSRALDWAAEHPAAHRAMAEHMLRADRLAEAAEAARRAADLMPGSAEHRHFLGVVLRRAGDDAGAAAAQRGALELRPDYAAARRELDQITRAAADGSPPAPLPPTAKETPWPRSLSA